MHTQIDLLEGVPLRRRTAGPRPDNAQARKANGQFLAVNKAGSVWVQNALDKLRLFCKLRKHEDGHLPYGAEFTFEEFRTYSELNGWPLPASVNAWGSLPTIAAKAGVVSFTGRFAVSKRPESHGRVCKIWRAL